MAGIRFVLNDWRGDRYTPVLSLDLGLWYGEGAEDILSHGLLWLYGYHEMEEFLFLEMDDGYNDDDDFDDYDDFDFDELWDYRFGPRMNWG